MSELITEPNFTSPDEFYQRLNQFHDGLSAEQSRDVNARLILLLSNHIGDQQVISEAMQIAREHLDSAS